MTTNQHELDAQDQAQKRENIYDDVFSGLPNDWQQTFGKIVEIFESDPDYFAGKSDEEYDNVQQVYHDIHSRSQRRNIEQNVLGHFEHVIGLGSFALMGDANAADTAYGLLRPRLGSGQQNAQAARVVAAAVAEAAETSKQTVDYSTQVAASAETTMTAVPAARYTLLKLLLGADMETPNAANLHEMLYIENATNNRINIPSKLLFELEAGQFDSELRADMLDYVISNPTVNEQFKRIAAMWQMASLCAPEVPADILRGRVLAAEAYWPLDTTKILHDVRASFTSGIRATLNERKAEYIQLGFGGKEDDVLERFTAAFSAAIRAQTKPTIANDPRGAYLGGYSKAEVMRARAELKLATTTRDSNNVENQEPARPTVVRQLHTIHRASGELFEQGSAEYEDLIGGYVDSHQGSVSLRSDVEKMLDYLARVDLSKGLIKGLKKYNSTVRFGDTESAVYAFKPTDAPGLSSSSLIARKTRIFCTINEGVVGVFSIVDRDKVMTIERNLGFGSKGGARS